MSLRIGHNVQALIAHRNLTRSSNAVAKSIERLSSGLRINSAADDPAGLALSERMRSQIRGLEQANRNIMDGISLLQTIDGVLNEVHSILHRARDLAVQWNNELIGPDGRQMILDEWAQLCAEVVRIEQTTRFNDLQLFTDANAIVTLQVGPNSGDTVDFRLLDLVGPNLNQIRIATFFAADIPGVRADIDGFDMHINDLSAARARFGAIANRLEYSMNANTASMENLIAAESRIRDVDFAAEMANLTKHQILQQSGLAMLAQANQNQAAILQLLAP